MSFDDWTHEGTDNPPSLPSAPTEAKKTESPTLFLSNPQNLGVLEGQRRGGGNILGGSCLLLFLLPFLIVGLMMPWWTFKTWARHHAIDADPVPVTARVSSHRTSTSDDDDDYYVTYVFRVDRDEFSRECEVSESDQTAAVERKTLPVTYCRTNPTLSRADAEQGQSVGFMLLFTLFWDGILLLIVGGGFSNYLRTRRLWREGVVRGGIVTQAESRLDSDDDLMVTVHYKFTDARGLVRTGRATRMRNDLKGQQLPDAGTPVAVLCSDSAEMLL